MTDDKDKGKQPLGIKSDIIGLVTALASVILTIILHTYDYLNLGSWSNKTTLVALGLPALLALVAALTKIKAVHINFGDTKAHKKSNNSKQ